MIAVVGAGAIGAALALHLERTGREVALLCTEFDGPILDAVRSGGNHPTIAAPIPGAIRLHERHAWPSVLPSAEIIVLAISTAGLISTVHAVDEHASPKALWVVATKGWDEATLRSASQVVVDELGDASRVLAIVGPSLAAEIAAGVPSAVVVAGENRAAATRVAEVFSSPRFRTFVSDDVAGVEVGAALKNVIAIAIGLCDGIASAYGVPALTNTKAFLFSRGLVEMAGLARALGGRAETVLGLAGAGDLFVTALGGRNARFGRLVGEGKTPEQALAEMRTTVEGYVNGRAAVALADKLGLDMPIVRAVARVVYDGLEPRAALDDVTSGAVEDELHL
jgi:glycerol-3-phosphate dehydrogenase (NAD(P)+)